MSQAVNLNRLEYEKRVNRVIDHVRAHLPDNLTLGDLAGVAAFSPFHFHRVFKSITNETLSEFIQRTRLEKAARTLAGNPDEPVIGIALDNGFASAATFARAFRAQFGMTATQWRDGGYLRQRRRSIEQRKLGKPVRKAGKAVARTTGDKSAWIDGATAMTVEVKDMPAYHVAYMRYVGPYGDKGLPEHWARFVEWMDRRGLDVKERTTLGVAYDDPHVTAPDKCRYDACLVIPQDFQADRWVNIASLPGGRCAVTDFVGNPEDIMDAWDRLFSVWLPSSGYQPDDRPCVEVYRPEHSADRDARRFSCELWLPVKPL
jgi:AraC family transcriptional regulator